MCEALAKAKDRVTQIVDHYDNIARQKPLLRVAKAR
jgi:hypothetical protein